MYSLDQTLDTVPGIGPKIFEHLQQKQLLTVRDLLLCVPLRYEDRSKTVTVEQLWQEAPLQPKTFFTVRARLSSASSVFLRGRSMQKATFYDDTGEKLTVTWFNNPFIVKRLKKDVQYRLSGTCKPMGKTMTMLQPLVEDDDQESINTNRLVPLYTSLDPLKPTTHRKILKDIIDNIEKIENPTDTLASDIKPTISINTALSQIHFPDSDEHAITARERIALEELLTLIQRSKHIKEVWKKDHQALSCTKVHDITAMIPRDLPFELTQAQQRCIKEIFEDIQKTIPMNRLLLGDVGSGKTVVAGTIMRAIVEQGAHACLVAPTQVLAEQHTKTLAKLYPEIEIQLITGKTEKPFHKAQGKQENRKTRKNHSQPTFIVGTHALLNRLTTHNLPRRQADSQLISHNSQPTTKIGLVVFDEQQRFGVNQRSSLQNLQPHPHILTMTATPIPRSLMLTIFSHLSLSVIDELPPNRIPTKTWLIPEKKRHDMYDWIAEQVQIGKLQNGKTGKQILTTHNSLPTTQFQALIVCPFIDPSNAESLENVASVKHKYEEIATYFAKLNIGLLHGKLKHKEKDAVITDLFSGKIDVLVTTPIVEVGIDLPQASAMIIEAAERFGLASLHQLRGRVGRAGQQGYCILFTNSKSQETTQRLKYFSNTLKGQELAEYDLQRRGAGDLFGSQQHGFDELRFAEWSDIQLIQQGQRISAFFEKNKQTFHSPLFKSDGGENKIPLAN